MTLSHPFFQSLPEDHHDTIRRLLLKRDLREGDVLVQQGMVADSAFFVTRGLVGVDVYLPGGGSSRLTELGPGGVLGELALVSAGQRRTATATALEPSEVLAMLGRDLQALCAHYHPASLALLRRLAEHVARSLVRVSDERLRLARAPTARLPDGVRSRPGADFDALRVLPKLAIASDMSDAEVRDLASSGRLWTFERDSVVFHAGQSRGSLFVVIRGSIELCAFEGGSARRLAIIGPGKVAGELGVLTSTPQRMNAVVREGATLLELPSPALAALADAQRPLSYRFALAMARSLMVQLELATRALAREQLGLNGNRGMGAQCR